MKDSERRIVWGFLSIPLLLLLRGLDGSQRGVVWDEGLSLLLGLAEFCGEIPDDPAGDVAGRVSHGQNGLAQHSTQLSLEITDPVNKEMNNNWKMSLLSNKKKKSV